VTGHWFPLYYFWTGRRARPEKWGDVSVGGNSLQLARDFAELAVQLRAERREQPTLDRVVVLAVQAIDTCDHCGITVRTPDGELTTPACSDPVAAEVAELQQRLGEGPCLQAAWELNTVTVTDLRSETRWPNWASAAAALGLRSVLSLRLEINGHLTASLNLFAESVAAFNSTDLAIAGIFARHAATALASAEVEEGLRAAAQSRQLIGAAQGILIQRFGLTLDQSFELLRRYSQTYNVKLRVLAQRLVDAGGISPSAPADPAATLEQALRLTRRPSVEN